LLGDEKELEFFKYVPTVWDDTKVIHGKVPEYAVIARQSGETWFVGCMNSKEARTLKVPLDFLHAGKKYVAHIYSDDPKVNTRTHVRIDRFTVDASTVLLVSVMANGGQAIRIVPAKSEDTYPLYKTNPIPISGKTDEELGLHSGGKPWGLSIFPPLCQ